MAGCAGAPVRRWLQVAAAWALAALLGSTLPPVHAAEPAAPVAAPSPAAPQPKFDVLELRVLGNTALDARTVEAAVYGFTGPGRQMTDVEAARAALEKVYHDRGFGTVFVDIPEQTVEDGIVRLRVTEGRLRQVRVSGAHYFSGRQILAALPAAQPGTVPDLPVLQKQITALNAETHDRTVVPVLKAGPQPGTVDLALKVEDHVPFHGSVELDNQYTVDTAHLRAAVAASYDNLFDRMDTFSVQYQAAPQAVRETHVVAGSYALHLAPDGSNLSIQYVNSKSDVATIGTLGVLGTGSVYSLRYLKPLPATGSVQDLALEVDYKDFTQSVLVSSASGLNTPVDYINMSAAYSFVKSRPDRMFDWSVIADFGFRGAPYNTQQFAEKRFDGAPNYYYLRSDGGATLPLPAGFTATLRLTGQFSADPLINNEQLPVGGVASVRGYLEAEELADSAARGSFQLGAPPLNLASGRFHLEEFVFYDAARAFTVDAPGQPHHVDLRSWGAGIRFTGFRNVSGALTWADPLTDGIRTLRGDSILLFDLRGYW